MDLFQDSFNKHHSLRQALKKSDNPSKLIELVDKEYLHNFLQVEYSNEKRIEILKMLYQQLHQIHKGDENFENKTAIYASSILLALSGYLFKDPPESLNNYAIATIGLLILFISAISIWILIRNSKRIRLDCRLIVRVETALGFYTNEGFALPSNISENETFQPSGEKLVSLFPQELREWGNSDDWLSLSPHIVAILVSASIASIILINLIVQSN